MMSRYFDSGRARTTAAINSSVFSQRESALRRLRLMACISRLLTGVLSPRPPIGWPLSAIQPWEDLADGEICTRHFGAAGDLEASNSSMMVNSALSGSEPSSGSSSGLGRASRLG